MRIPFALLLLLAVAWLPTPAGAQAPPAGTSSAPAPVEPGPAGFSPPPPSRLIFNNLLVLRYNPLGLENQLRAGWQKRLLARSDVLRRDTFFFAGLLAKLNPAFLRVGPA